MGLGELRIKTDTLLPVIPKPFNKLSSYIWYYWEYMHLATNPVIAMYKHVTW